MNREVSPRFQFALMIIISQDSDAKIGETRLQSSEKSRGKHRMIRPSIKRQLEGREN